MKDGINELVVRVEAADKSVSLYTIQAFKPSCIAINLVSDASLSDVKILGHVLGHPFENNDSHFYVTTPYHTTVITFSPILRNPAASMEMNVVFPAALYLGETQFCWAVTSADKSNKSEYSLTVLRGALGL